ncbi:hypothetical protein J3A83DRAFT_1072495 [Scleroderma citrinum]
MVHQCIDWSVNPPARKINAVVLSYGDAHVYAIAPAQFKDLEELTRREFNLGDAELEFYSSCINLCNPGVPARIGEQVWRGVSSFIGCLFVIARNPPASTGQSVQPSEVAASTPPPEQPYTITLDDNGHDVLMNETREHDGLKIPSINETETDVGHTTRAPVSDVDVKTTDDEGKSQAPGPTRVLRRRRSGQSVNDSAVSDDEDRPSRRLRSVKRGQTSSSVVSGQTGKRESPSKAKKQRVESTSRSPSKGGRETKKEREGIDRPVVKHQAPRQDSLSPSRPIKQEKSADKMPTSSQSHDIPPEPINTQAQDSGQQLDNQRMLIRVGHRPSRQESKFTVKGSTKVSKVIASVCKSFGLDASQARLFLIVETDDDEGVKENLFPCDRGDSMARAGAEGSGESKFLLKLSDEPSFTLTST